MDHSHVLVADSKYVESSIPLKWYRLLDHHRMDCYGLHVVNILSQLNSTVVHLDIISSWTLVIH